MTQEAERPCGQPALVSDEAPAGLRPSGFDRAQDEFVGWIADRFQQRHVPGLSRAEAERLARDCLACGIEDAPFGHPDFGWQEDDAHALADEEVESCWEFIA